MIKLIHNQIIIRCIMEFVPLFNQYLHQYIHRKIENKKIKIIWIRVKR
jgi:hypothetical protein